MSIPILDIALKIIDKIIPDPKAKAEAHLKVLELQQKGDLSELDADLKINLAQMEINKVEAASENLLKSGWRPAIGWCGALGLFVTIFVYPLAQWLSMMYGWPLPPKPETEELNFLLYGMLGFGGMRTFEKFKKLK